MVVLVRLPVKPKLKLPKLMDVLTCAIGELERVAEVDVPVTEYT